MESWGHLLSIELWLEFKWKGYHAGAVSLTRSRDKKEIVPNGNRDRCQRENGTIWSFFPPLPRSLSLSGSPATPRHLISNIRERRMICTLVTLSPFSVSLSSRLPFTGFFSIFLENGLFFPLLLRPHLTILLKKIPIYSPPCPIGG